MKTSWQNFTAAIERFFYAPEMPYGMALVRITLPLVMMSMILPRWPFAREIFSSDGATAPLAIGYGYVNLLPEFSGAVAVALFSLLTVSLFTISLGLCTRASLIVCVVLYTYFCNLDAVSTMTKYSVITTHVLLLLACSNCGRLWSIDAWLSKAAATDPNFAIGPAWPRRCMQLLIGFVYFGAAITKMNTPTFLTGDQLQFWMLTHINFRHPLGEVFALYPVLLKGMAYVTIVWEVTFIFLVWRGFWRPWVLAIGVIFHFLTVLTLGLMIFPMCCFSCYLAFADEQDVAGIREWWQGRLAKSSRLMTAWTRILATLPAYGSGARWQTASWFATGGLAIAALYGGMGIEYLMDPYGIRRPEGKYTLKEADPLIVQQIFTPRKQLRTVDKFFAIDTGTILVGDLLANRRRTFRHGETIIAQCNLTPPHEDMWIECKILDADNRLVDRVGNIAIREQFRSNFVYPVSETMAAGEYTLIFENGGHEVLRRKISIVGAGNVAAN